MVLNCRQWKDKALPLFCFCTTTTVLKRCSIDVSASANLHTGYHHAYCIVVDHILFFWFVRVNTSSQCNQCITYNFWYQFSSISHCCKLPYAYIVAFHQWHILFLNCNFCSTWNALPGCCCDHGDKLGPLAAYTVVSPSALSRIRTTFHFRTRSCFQTCHIPGFKSAPLC